MAARHLSLTGAAGELNVTPAAVSQQVRLLELRLGEPLFVRHARGLRLTRAGEALVPACRESFDRLEATIGELFGRRQRNQLVIRVALGFARPWLLDRLAGFSRQHPEVALRVVATIWAGDPLDTSVDLDVRLAPDPVPGLASHQLTQDFIFPVCRPELARAAPRIRQPSDLRNHRLLTTIGFAQGWKDWFAAANVEPPPTNVAAIEFDSMRLALDAAVLGHGVALARSSYVADLVAARQLRALFDVRLKARDNVFLLHASGLEAGSPAARLRDWLIADRQRGRAARRPAGSL
jgi:LysR family glycine cleavage system transcriptional activator